MNELEEILELLGEEQLEELKGELFLLLANCVASQHFQVARASPASRARRALFFFFPCVLRLRVQSAHLTFAARAFCRASLLPWRKVVERTLFLWNNETLCSQGCLSRRYTPELLPMIYGDL
jgi:serine/threonine-protein phosphatase 2A regulatory subunit B'